MSTEGFRCSDPAYWQTFDGVSIAERLDAGDTVTDDDLSIIAPAHRCADEMRARIRAGGFHGRIGFAHRYVRATNDQLLAIFNDDAEGKNSGRANRILNRRARQLEREGL